METKTESFPCGCAIMIGKSGEIRGVKFCGEHDSLFDQHKSLKQLSVDLHHQLLVHKHFPPEKTEEAKSKA